MYKKKNNNHYEPIFIYKYIVLMSVQYFKKLLLNEYNTLSFD